MSNLISGRLTQLWRGGMQHKQGPGGKDSKTKVFLACLQQNICMGWSGEKCKHMHHHAYKYMHFIAVPKPYKCAALKRLTI